MPENRTYRNDGLEFQVAWTDDDDSADLSYLDPERDRDRLLAWHRGDWSMLQCAVTARIWTEALWALPQTVGRAYLSQIESDSDAGHIADIEEQLESEALEDARLTMAALQRVLQPVEAGPVEDDRQLALALSWLEVEA